MAPLVLRLLGMRSEDCSRAPSAVHGQGRPLARAVSSAYMPERTADGLSVAGPARRSVKRDGSWD